MKTIELYNTAHPLAESGKPIFIPFGEWPYDEKSRQRLDRAHGEAIANELNARVAKGEPGIPIYQGHPDVPALASRYPDKGALGWVTKIALANENGKDGLALTVEWDRDPGKGFKWFSPYWFANEKDRDGQTYIVANIRSIGLVNNPNIREFRLANEAQPEERKTMNPFQLPQRIIDLANEFDESKHPCADDGKWTSAPGGGARTKALQMLSSGALGTGSRANVLSGINDKLHETRAAIKYHPAAGTVPYESEARKMAIETRRGVHAAAILHGFKYNRDSHQYE